MMNRTSSQCLLVLSVVFLVSCVGGCHHRSTTSRIQDRTYIFREAGGKETSYSLYVPKTYDPAVKSPLIVLLHGYECTPRHIMGYEKLTEFAQRDGYIVVAPMGHVPEGYLGGTEGVDLHVDQGMLALYEKDIMNVLRIIRTQYNIDSDRIFLTGHSMGGGGTYILGAKYPRVWAALAPISGGGIGPHAPGENLRNLPILVMHGGKDELVPVQSSRDSVAKMKQLGIEHIYIEVPDGDHTFFVMENPDNLSKVFAFFNIVGKKRAPVQLSDPSFD